MVDYRNERLEKSLLRKKEEITHRGSEGSAHPETPSCDPRAELVADGRRFDEDIAKIRKYFYREIRQRILERKTDDEIDILRRKSDLLKNYERIIRCERDIDTRPAIMRFQVDLLISTLLSTLLSVSLTYRWSYVGAMVFLVKVTFNLAVVLHDTIELFKHLSRRVRSAEELSSHTSNYLQNPRPQTSQPSTGIVLDNLSTF